MTNDIKEMCDRIIENYSNLDISNEEVSVLFEKVNNIKNTVNEENALVKREELLKIQSVLDVIYNNLIDSKKL